MEQQEKNDLAFPAQLYLYGKNHTYELCFDSWRKLNNTQSGKFHNHFTKCQIRQLSSPFCLSLYQDCKLLTSCALMSNALPHFQVSSKLLHHRNVNDWYPTQFNLMSFTIPWTNSEISSYSNTPRFNQRGNVFQGKSLNTFTSSVKSRQQPILI